MEKKKIKNLGKGIAISIVIVLLVLVIAVVRKVIIIKDLEKKVSNYTNITNYYEKAYQNQDGNIIVTESYVKDGNYLTTVNSKSETGERKIIGYSNGKTVNTYIESNEEKIVLLNSNGIPGPLKVNDWFYTENIFQSIYAALRTSIKTVEYNGKECYQVDNFYGTNFLYENGSTSILIEKETGLPLKVVNGATFEYTYSFNTVTDSDIVEPDINQYTIHED